MMHLLIFTIVSILLHSSAAQLHYNPESAIYYHNLFRSWQGASNMRMMVWDQQLAEETADYASKCDFSHDGDRGNVGENIYATSSKNVANITGRGIQAWYNEIKDYDLGSNNCAAGEICGHYTQVVWANSYRLGCAASECPVNIKNFRAGIIFICRYGPHGNIKGAKPFVRGDKCSGCEGEWGNCVDGLCATDDMVQETTTTALPPSSATTTTRLTTPDPVTTPSTTRKTTTTTVYSSTDPDTMATTTTEEPWTTDEPIHPEECGCSCNQYKEVISEYRVLLKDWKAKYQQWKEKYNIGDS